MNSNNYMGFDERKNVNSDKYVDVCDASAANGAAIIQWPYHGGSNQKWHIVPTGDGYYKILSSLSGKALCVKDASNTDGAKIVQWSYGSALNDQWEILAP